ncbi:ABC transporter ATP-binding protein, partial [Streptomyces cinerochromogenes]
MSTATAVLLDELAADQAGNPVPERLREWAAVGRPQLRRAGLLRGAAQAGTVVWACGLAWTAQRGLAALHGAPVPSVLAPALVTAAGVALRAVLLSAGETAAA